MMRGMRIFAGASAIAGLMSVAALEAMAQPVEQQRQRVREVVVYGSDPCPVGTGDEVIVCARRPETERFRVPEPLRTTPPGPESESWANRARALEEAQETGIGSCTPVGPGGSTGCLQEMIDASRDERGEDAAVQPPQR